MLFYQQEFDHESQCPLDKCTHKVNLKATKFLAQSIMTLYSKQLHTCHVYCVLAEEWKYKERTTFASYGPFI